MIIHTELVAHSELTQTVQASVYFMFLWLQIQYRDSTTYPEIDGIDGAFTIEKSRPHNLNKMADGVVVGAFVTESQAFEKSKYR